LPCDFQMINRVIVKGKEYFYGLPRWFVSRKVLQILLKHAKGDLRPIGMFLKKSFVPVPITESNKLQKNCALCESEV